VEFALAVKMVAKAKRAAKRYIYRCLYAYICLNYVYLFTWIFVHEYIYMWIYICMFIYMYVCKYIYCMYRVTLMSDFDRGVGALVERIDERARLKVCLIIMIIFSLIIPDLKILRTLRVQRNTFIIGFWYPITTVFCGLTTANYSTNV
jgi:hypothetical protein